MKCLNCGFVNPEDGRFCQQCGKPLEKICPVCATPNPKEARFCKNCGTSLILEPKTAENQKSPLAPLGSSGARGASERRLVTVLFADVVGSTSLAEQMDPEDWTRLMNRVFSWMGRVIERYEGKIARLMGDALLVFFGAPVSHEDDPLRAAAAALDLMQAAHSFSDEIRAQYGLDFAIRVGLNTGPVVVGDVGSSQVFEYTAMGDAVNLAARMQAAARPMSVFLSENTYRFLAPAFQCADLGSIAVRGKTEPVHVYELLAVKEKSHLLREGGLQSEMVGRDEEIYSLLQLSQALSAGLGRAALVSGEPGIGKTRLIAEWKARLLREQEAGQASVLWAEGRCLSYGRSLAYHLAVDVFRSGLGLTPSEDGAVCRATLQRVCQSLFADSAGTVFPYLAHLLGLPLEEADRELVSGLDPKTLQEHYQRSLRKLLIRMAADRPIILVLEDIHWADPSSTDLLARLFPLALNTPVLFCLVTRPDRETPGWKLVLELRQQLGASLTEINLHALSKASSDRLISNLVAAAPLPAALHQLILEKSEGNPLFVEELVRMLVERGILAKEGNHWQVTRPVESVDIPDSLQSLLQARIDQLPEDVKRTLRVAAVIGRQFPVRVLEEVLKNYVTA